MSGSDQQNLMEVTGRSAESLEIMARALHVKNAELQPTLEAIASTAVTMLSPARYAALTVLSRGELIPRASTGEPPLLLDRLQQRLGDGPCVNAAKHQSVFRIEDTREDQRWPQFCAEAARLKVRSMLCVPLWIDERGLGALSLYADQAAAFSEPARAGHDPAGHVRGARPGRSAARRPDARRTRQPGRHRAGQGHLDGTARRYRRRRLRRLVTSISGREHEAGRGRPPLRGDRRAPERAEPERLLARRPDAGTRGLVYS